MKQTDGDRNFIPPPLKTAPVFGGIAGIMAGEQGDAEDAGHMPSVTTKSRDAGDDLRELYRRTLAADWTCQPGDPSADKCIEDIFAGGDGWGNLIDGNDTLILTAEGMLGGGLDGGGDLSDGETATLRRSKQRNWSGFFGRKGHGKKGSAHEVMMPEKDDDAHLGALHMHHMHETPRGVRGRGSFEHQAAQMKGEVERRTRPPHEIDESDIREDLRCWKAPDVR
jgi:hypothetical protein